MRILYLNDYGTPTGGAETVAIALRDGMRLRGHETRLFTSSAHPQGAISAADHECLGTLGRWRTALQTCNPSAYFQLKHVLLEFRPDVVHVKVFLTQLSPMILPLLRSVPSLYHAVWYRAACPMGTKTLPDMQPCTFRVGKACAAQGCLSALDWPVLMAQMKLWRRWAGAFDEIIPISQPVKSALEAEGIACGEVIPNGVAERSQRQQLDDLPLVVFAGRLVKEKGVDLLLDAMAMILRQAPAARLLIAGEGPERAILEQRARHIGIDASVEFCGHLSQPQMEDRFAGAWVQVVCSRWAEPFGMVAIEAMMRGTATIVSRVGGLSEIVEDGTSGLSVPPNDVKALASAIAGLLSDRDRADALGRAGRARAISRYGQTQFLDRFEAIYQRMVRYGKRAGRQGFAGQEDRNVPIGSDRC